MISYYGRVAILGYIEIHYYYYYFLSSLFFFFCVCVHISLANKQTKRNSERKEERKKEKETGTGWVRNVIFKGTAL